VSARESLAFDVETIGCFDAVPAALQERLLTRWEAAEARLPPDQRGDPKRHPATGAALSPWTGQVASIAIWSAQRGRGVTYYQDPEGGAAVFEDDVWYVPCPSEARLLSLFWGRLARHPHARMVSFNGRSFDGPFLQTRSFLLGVPASRNLVPYRYSTRDHLDLFDVLGFWQGKPGAVPGLEAVCLALGIESPKADGMDGGGVDAAWRAGRRLDVARYNARDARATAALEARWSATLGDVFGERSKTG
jgi:3'-5' exonuclease